MQKKNKKNIKLVKINFDQTRHSSQAKEDKKKMKSKIIAIIKKMEYSFYLYFSILYIYQKKSKLI